MVSKTDMFVDTGPYRWIRHPIYVIYLINDVRGVLVAGILAITFLNVLFFGVLVLMRVDKEEILLIDKFGKNY